MADDAPDLDGVFVGDDDVAVVADLEGGDGERGGEAAAVRMRRA